MGRPAHPGASPLRGRYLVRNRAWNAWLRLNDAFVELFSSRAEPSDGSRVAPRRILVAVGGHLGDAVLATSLLRDLRQALPAAEIGILTGSWNVPVFERHPRVRWIHAVNHWKLSRAAEPLLSRWLTARRTQAEALSAIRGIGYDTAIDLSAYYPNAARLLWRAGIPVRVGYISGGDGGLFTHREAWTPGRHVAEDHRVLLARLVPHFEAGPTVCELADIPAAAERGAAEQLRLAGIAGDPFAVVHIGAGHSRKEWPLQKWETVTRALIAGGLRVVLTGRGDEQTAVTDRLARSIPGCVSLSDRLDWEEYRSVIARARVVLSVDTVAMHLAAASGTPCVALSTAMDDPQRWRPLSARAIVVTHPVPCAPCFRSRGCEEMSCIRDVTPESVMRSTNALLEG